MSSAICFNLDQSKILSSGNELSLYTIEVEREIALFREKDKQADIQAGRPTEMAIKRSLKIK